MKVDSLYALQWTATFIALCDHPACGVVLLALWPLGAAARALARHVSCPIIAEVRTFLRAPQRHLTNIAVGCGAVTAIAAATCLPALVAP